jgi:hypothetical protein
MGGAFGSAFPCIEQAVIGDDLALRCNVEGRKASGDQVVQRAKRIRALIGIAGAGDGLQLYGLAERRAAALSSTATGATGVTAICCDDLRHVFATSTAARTIAAAISSNTILRRIWSARRIV